MKRVAGMLLTLCLLAGLSGCQLLYMEPQERLTFLDGIIEDVGRTQLTEDQNLIGKRTTSPEDMYIGTYQAECSEANGRDVIFGGTSLLERKVLLEGEVQTVSGKAEIRIRMNGDVIEPAVDQNGSFRMELDFQSGGNYITVLYEDFKGIVTLKTSYI